MKRNTSILTLAIILSAFSFLNAQDEGLLYGEVTTIDGNSYEGALRWGKEEVFWTDMFNASKLENENIRYLSREEREKLEERYFRKRKDNWFVSLVNSFDLDENDFTHQFVCQFGEIKSIRPFRRDRVDIEMQNGDRLEVSGQGYNDIGADIQVYDQEIGMIKIDWGRIEEITFRQAPKKMEYKFGAPLYGSVETYKGTFTGTIQWDHDERLSTDKLDGDSQDGDVSIEFGNIAAIERDGYRSSIVTLKSGRKMNLDGSNDVNAQNRGIIVNTDFGRVDIPWKEFKRVDFTNNDKNVVAYTDFNKQENLNGKVKVANGDIFEGRIVFDLDEEKAYEVLQGMDDRIEYIIPFRNISKIAPRNYAYSNITLKNGKSLLLGDSQDVSDKNTGVLVFEGNSPTYIAWEDIEEIIFQ